MRQAQAQLSLRIPENLQKRMRNLVARGVFLNQSDFVRNAIRDKLTEVEKEIPRTEATS